jgi:phenylpyruvate tautomerase PptA (4-oxalocrotonate tautomerase family)
MPAHTLNNEKIINKIVTKLNLENLITNITDKIVETIETDKLVTKVAINYYKTTLYLVIYKIT